MDRDEVEVHKNARKELGQHPAILTKLAWSITHKYCRSVEQCVLVVNIPDVLNLMYLAMKSVEGSGTGRAH